MKRLICTAKTEGRCSGACCALGHTEKDGEIVWVCPFEKALFENKNDTKED